MSFRKLDISKIRWPPQWHMLDPYNDGSRIEAALTAQNDEFKGNFHSSSSAKKLNTEPRYLLIG